MAREVVVDRMPADQMPADPVVGRVVGHVQNQMKARDQEVVQDHVVAQGQGVDPGPEAGVTVDIS